MFGSMRVGITSIPDEEEMREHEEIIAKVCRDPPASYYACYYVSILGACIHVYRALTFLLYCESLHQTLFLTALLLDMATSRLVALTAWVGGVLAMWGLWTQPRECQH